MKTLKTIFYSLAYLALFAAALVLCSGNSTMLALVVVFWGIGAALSVFALFGAVMSLFFGALKRVKV